MQAHPSLPQAPDMQRLLWVLSPSGWALGWMSRTRAELDQSWPQGESPVECPAPDLAWALRQVLGDRRGAGLPLHLLVCAWVGDGRPAWWPDASRRLKPWRELARDTDLSWQSVRVMDDELGDASIWEAGSRVWPQARVLRGIHGLAGLVPRTPSGMLSLSVGAVVVLHLTLWGVVRPAWIKHQAQTQMQAAWAHEQDLVRQAQARTQAAEAERQAQWRTWQARQNDARLALQQWLALVDQADRVARAQVWTEMRWSQDAWTVWGIASHEAAWQVLQAGASPNWQLELIESTPTIWPPGALEGTPAWRYQIRLHAQGTDRTGAQGGAP